MPRDNHDAGAPNLITAMSWSLRIALRSPSEMLTLASAIPRTAIRAPVFAAKRSIRIRRSVSRPSNALPFPVGRSATNASHAQNAHNARTK